MFTDHTLSPLAYMAKKKGKRKMFRKMIDLHLEDVGSAGNWNSIAYFKKLQEFQSAYIDYVKVTWITSDIAGSDVASTRGSNVAGYMFAVNNTTNTPITASENTIGVAAGAATGGSISIPVKRRIVDNDVDQTRNDGRLYLWMRSTDYTVDDQIDVLCFVEVFGTFHDVVSP